MLLIKKARIIDGNRSGKTQDILIRNGRIAEIGAGIKAPEGAGVWSSPELCVSPGWFDVGVQVCDPGEEHREDLGTALAAAAAGGFTAIACFPNTHPALHGKSEILYAKNKAKSLSAAVELYPIGAVSQDCAGKDMAELMDMNAAGAIAFSDGNRSIDDAGLLLRALQYAQAFDGLVFNKPHQKSVAAGGQIHEGLVSTSLGMKGIPALAEELMVQRDLRLLEYTGGRIHLHLISTAKSVALVRAAKKQGLQVTCSAAVVNLCFTDEKMSGFNSNWKVLPPLRSKADVKALHQGLKDGTIDFICSNHTPWHEEAKNLEFPYAEFGMSGLETAFSLCTSCFGKHLDLDMLVEKLALGPRRVLGIPVPEIKPGAPANLVAFDPSATWHYTEQQARSRSKNSPFLGQKLTGKVIGVVHNGAEMAF